MVSQSTRVSSHNSPHGSSILDRQGIYGRKHDDPVRLRSYWRQMSSSALVRSQTYVGTAKNCFVRHSFTADLTMRRSTPMDQECAEHSVSGPTGSVSRPSPHDPYQCAHSGRRSPRGSTCCLNGNSTRWSRGGRLVSMATRPYHAMATRPWSSGGHNGNPMAGSTNFHPMRSEPAKKERRPLSLVTYH